MDSRQEDKLGMAIKTNLFLTANAAAVAANAIIATGNATLKTAIDNIINADSTATRNLTGFTQTKEQKRVNLEKSVLTVAAASLGYYTTNEDLSKQALVRFSKSDIERSRDADLLVIADQVSDIATPIIASLAPWGVVAANLTSLTADTTAFKDWIKKPRVEQINSQVAGGQVDGFFDTVDDVLGKLDNQMAVYQFTNESLYNGYSLSRSVDDSGGGSDSSNFSLQDAAIGANETITIYTGTLNNGKRLYLRFISSAGNKVRMCTSATAATACADGFTATANNTYKKSIGDFGLDVTKTNINITNLSGEVSEVRWGWEL